MSSENFDDLANGASWQLQFGALPSPGGGVKFRVWSPHAERISVRIDGSSERSFPLERADGNVFEIVVPGIEAGTDYFYTINDTHHRPDPVSRWQPDGVHGASRVVDPHAFDWSDRDWTDLPLEKFLIYELHTGTFTPEGTFESVIDKLPYLKELGITAIELMPVAEFPGARNWGYDGVHLYAPQSTYGGPQGLKKLIDACHRAGLAVVLDVVYNHLGPEGNYLRDYAPYFSRNYLTPWGEALNFDDSGSDGVRRHFIDNALYWLTEYHVDALRLDAIHRMIDTSPRHILQELATTFHRHAAHLGRSAHLIAESDLNDVRVINPTGEGGYGFDAQWSDDFHHSLHRPLTRTERGIFSDFGSLQDLRTALTEGFVYSGQHSPHRRKRHGTSSLARPGQQFVVFIQNHDQIANHYWGQRLASLVSFEQQKLAAAILLFAPNIPMLFMGQEYGETAPFYFFTSHTDPHLIEAVRTGRQREYADYAHSRPYADPQSPETFQHSKLHWPRATEPPHALLLAFYRDLIALRHQHPSLSNCRKDLTRVEHDEHHHWLTIQRRAPSPSTALLLSNLSDSTQTIPIPTPSIIPLQLSLFTADPIHGGHPDLPPPPPTLNAAAGTKAPQLTITLPSWSVAIYTC